MRQVARAGGIKNHARMRLDGRLRAQLINWRSVTPEAAGGLLGIRTRDATRLLNRLVGEGVLTRERAGYFPRVVARTQWLGPPGPDGAEFNVYEEHLASALNGLPPQVEERARYIAGEMLNNAFEHAQADHVHATITATTLGCVVYVADTGVGLPQGLEEATGLSMAAAALQVFTGKFTTKPETHTGEGLFFSSRVSDMFGAFSGGVGVRCARGSDWRYTVGVDAELGAHTTIFATLDQESPLELGAVFEAYQDDEGCFVKTDVPVRMINEFANPTSRSQARRMAARFKQFKVVTLDFDGVQTMAYPFAHEIFVNFRKRDPEVELKVANAAPAVLEMIRRVQAEA